jgi:hypothetical protein
MGMCHAGVTADAPRVISAGAYAPAKRRGPALWLRCIEARVVEGASSPTTTPIFTCLHPPGKAAGRGGLPQELATLVELQYRAVLWLHGNGKE